VTEILLLNKKNEQLWSAIDHFLHQATSQGHFKCHPTIQVDYASNFNYLFICYYFCAHFNILSHSHKISPLMVMTIYSHMMGGKSQTKPVQKESTELINRRKLTQSNSLISYGSFPDQLNLAPRSFFFFPINNLYYFRPTFS
jgi:hypothetical protein